MTFLFYLGFLNVTCLIALVTTNGHKNIPASMVPPATFLIPSITYRHQHCHHEEMTAPCTLNPCGL